MNAKQHALSAQSSQSKRTAIPTSMGKFDLTLQKLLFHGLLYARDDILEALAVQPA